MSKKLNYLANLCSELKKILDQDGNYSRIEATHDIISNRTYTMMKADKIRGRPEFNDVQKAEK